MYSYSWFCCFSIIFDIRFNSISFDLVRLGFLFRIFSFKYFNRALSFIAAIHYILAIVFHDFTVSIVKMDNKKQKKSSSDWLSSSFTSTGSHRSNFLVRFFSLSLSFAFSVLEPSYPHWFDFFLSMSIFSFWGSATVGRSAVYTFDELIRVKYRLTPESYFSCPVQVFSSQFSSKWEQAGDVFEFLKLKFHNIFGIWPKFDLFHCFQSVFPKSVDKFLLLQFP